MNNPIDFEKTLEVIERMKIAKIGKYKKWESMIKKIKNSELLNNKIKAKKHRLNILLERTTHEETKETVLKKLANLKRCEAGEHDMADSILLDPFNYEETKTQSCLFCDYITTRPKTV